MRIREDKFAAPEEVVGGAPAVPPTPTAPVAPKAAAEEVPPEIEGLTPVQVLEKAKAENARIVAELTGTFTQTLKDQATASTPPAQARRAAQAAQQGPQPQAPPQQQQQSFYTPPVAAMDEEEASILTNPTEFVSKIVERRVGGLQQAAVQSSRNLAKTVFTGQNPDDMKKYGEEVEQFVNGLHPASQMTIEAYSTGLAFVKSQHLTDIEANIRQGANAGAAGIVARSMATQGYTEEQITAVVKDLGPAPPPAPEQVAGIQAPTSSLFQRNVGVPVTERGRVVSAVSAVSAASPTEPSMSQEEKRLAGEFGMTEAEWKAERELNTDQVSQIKRGL